MSEEWMVRRQSTSGICHVQLRTASPLGADIAGPFGSQREACKRASDLFDDTGTDQGRCSGYGNGSVSLCSNEGVKLPK